MFPAKKYYLPVVVYLIFFMVVIGGLPVDAHAGFAGADMFGNTAVPDKSADFEKIQAVLEKKIIGQRLKDLGLDPGEISAKLGGLTDGQLHKIASQIDNLYAGGTGGLSLIISLLLIVLLVVVILQITGHKVIVTKN